MEKHYRATEPDFWNGRIDGQHREAWRWHQAVQVIDLREEGLPPLQPGQQGVVLLGFCVDEGVRRNGGRVGASHAPLELRRALGNLPVHFDEQQLLLDGGDVYCHDNDLERAQQVLGLVIAQVLQAGYRPLVLGGGHETSYGHYLGLRHHLQQTAPAARLGIINFDAHFDLRTPDPAVGPSSGTPFFQAAQDQHALGLPFDYLVLGLQKHSNTRLLYDTAQQLGVQYVSGRRFHSGDKVLLTQRIVSFLDQVDYVYLSVDMDVFSAAYAPGVSAPALVGISPDPLFLKMFKKILKSGKVLGADVVEYNPTYDIDNHTARLAASLCFEWVNAR